MYTSFPQVHRESAQSRTPYNTDGSGTFELDGAMATIGSTGRGERRMVDLWRRPDADGILHTPIPASESPALCLSDIHVPRKQ